MTQAIQESVMIVPVFYGGKWITYETTEFTKVHNPSTGEVIAQTPHCNESVVNAAVEAAQIAFLEWSTTSVTARAAILFRYKALLEQHFDEWSRAKTAKPWLKHRAMCVEALRSSNLLAG
jgi:acyl-CoA reductase-like NAD-dependent aldehyde dehydrogenase